MAPASRDSQRVEPAAGRPALSSGVECRASKPGPAPLSPVPYRPTGQPRTPDAPLRLRTSSRLLGPVEAKPCRLRCALTGHTLASPRARGALRLDTRNGEFRRLKLSGGATGAASDDSELGRAGVPAASGGVSADRSCEVLAPAAERRRRPAEDGTRPREGARSRRARWLTAVPSLVGKLGNDANRLFTRSVELRTIFKFDLFFINSSLSVVSSNINRSGKNTFVTNV